MKKTGILLLAILLTFARWGGPALSEKNAQYQSGDFTYVVLEDGTAEITLYMGGANELSIPQAFDDYAITSIGVAAFNWSENLSSVTIPEGITSIGDETFAGCASLKSVVLPDSVTGIGGAAFFGCEALTSLTLPQGVTSIGQDAFTGCKKLTLIVVRDSYAEGYAEENGIRYT